MPNNPAFKVSGDELVQNIWEDLEEPQIEFDELDKHFSVPPTKKKEPKQPTTETSKVTAVRLLAAKRSQNVEIVMKKWQKNNIDADKIEQAIYNIDLSEVSFVDHIQKLNEVKATKEELELINSHFLEKPDVPVAESEQFLYRLSKISMFDDRIECIIVQHQLFDDLGEIVKKLNNFKYVCDMLVQGQGTRKVMGIILACGNYMNGGNAQRGQADGFAIDILPKLNDVKSKDNSMTLLQYVVRSHILIFDNKKGTAEATLPVPEVSDIQYCSQIDFETIKGDRNNLEKSIQNIQRVLSKVVAESDQDHLEPFQSKVTAFIEEATGKLKDLGELIDECTKKFMITMKFFHFTPKGCKPEDAKPLDFFDIWLPFCQDYKDLWKSEQSRIAKENEKAEFRMKLKLRTESLRDFKTEPTKPGGLKEKLLKHKARNQNRM